MNATRKEGSKRMRVSLTASHWSPVALDTFHEAKQSRKDLSLHEGEGGGEGSTLFDFVWLCQADQTFSSFRGWFLTWLTHRVSREHVASRVDQVQSLFELCVSCCPWCIPVSDSEEHSGSRSTHGHVGRRTNETTWVQVLWQPVRSYHARRRETTTRDTRNLKRERRKRRKKERKKEKQVKSREEEKEYQEGQEGQEGQGSWVLARHSSRKTHQQWCVCLCVCWSYLVLCSRDESARACDALLTTEASLVHRGSGI